jgi:hypothetical protein
MNNILTFTEKHTCFERMVAHLCLRYIQGSIRQKCMFTFSSVLQRPVHELFVF